MAMFGAIVSSLIFDGMKRILESFPDLVKELWNGWELRWMVLVSLTLQIVLIFFGNKRKRIFNNLVAITLWCAYLMADWVATVALGIISKKQGKHNGYNNNKNYGPDNQVAAFWAPFLLLHLGGPDTITAYALEDNELWSRHLLGLAVQTVVASNIFLMALSTSGSLSLPSMLVFVAGLIKYAERTLSLWSASRNQFRDSMRSNADAGPDYVKFMEEYSLKKAEGFFVSTGEVIKTPPTESHDTHRSGSTDASRLRQSYDLFLKFKCLFANLILSFQDREQSLSFFKSFEDSDSGKNAFEVIDIELSFVYDVFYTKAPIVYTWKGGICRSISFTFTFLAFLLFLTAEKGKHAKVDVILTYTLLIVAIALEIYAVIVLLSSEWTGVWLISKQEASIFNFISCFQQNVENRWSNRMAQFSLLAFCLKEKPVPCLTILKFCRLAERLENFWYNKHKEVPEHLKEFFFEKLKARSDMITPDADAQVLYTCGDRNVLRENIPGKLDWTTTVEFDQRILLWHIATDLCYYPPYDDRPWDDEIESDMSNRLKSKYMSDYMLYLLVICPSMLPIGIGQIRYRDTCAEAMKFFEGRGCKKDIRDACDMLREVNTEVLPVEVKGDRSKSVLFDSCRIAKVLLEEEEDKRWKIISEVWLELLSYAASQCQEMYHAQRLRRGGELLTHVWLLMAHLGITKQFQIKEGHARAKLHLK